MKGSMDELLRDTLRTRAADPAAACLDPEMAAAFVDGMLSARARSGAEAHVADCARCQAVLAALVRSTPPPIERAWWRRPAVAWLAPLTVAATAVAIWINVPDRANAPPLQTQRDAVPPVESSPIQPQPTAAPPAPQAQSRIGGAADARAAGYEMQRARQTTDFSAKPRLAGTAPGVTAGGLDVGPATPPSTDQRAARPPAVVAPQPAPPDAASSSQRTADRVPTAAPGRPSALAETSVAVTATQPVLDPLVVARSVPPAPQTTIISPDRKSQWQIGAGGAVQHSADAGMTWRAQATGVNGSLTSGSSPSPSVCWLVGPGGLELITSDEGQSWRRVPFPVVTDLVAVRATDESIAIITTSDGRTFATSDGGASWRQ